MSKATILLVDDNPANLEVLLKALANLGFKLLIALSGEQALQQIERARAKPDLILLDIMMPGMDGFETCYRLKQQDATKEIPVIFMTMLEDTQDKLKGFQVGGVDYITKPLQVKEVLARVETHLGLRNLQKELQEKNAQLQQEIAERKQVEEELQQYRNHLEKLVKERTADLTRANEQLQQEIAERKRTEEALRESHEKYSMLFNKMLDGFALHEIICDDSGKPVDYRFLDLNPAFEELTGLKRNDLINKTVLEVLPGTESYWIEQYGNVALTGKPIHFENFSEELGKYYEVTAFSPRKGQFAAVFVDTTKRRQAEEALRTSEDQYRRLIENVTDGIGIIQKEQWVFVNDALAFMLAVTPEQLLGKAPVELFHGDVKKQIRKVFEQLQQRSAHAQKTWDVLQCVTTRAGQEVWLEGHYSLIEWEQKPAIVMSMRDITERKLRELALEQEKEQFRQESLQLRATLGERYRFGDLIGKSAVMQEIYELILKAAATNANVVIHGESGTGKEVVARMIHQLSDRQKGPFIPVNCAGFTEALFESEFFGYRKGAFTGADKDKPGFFDAAHGGTLFLDEVAELSLIMQAKLLRVIDGSGYTPLGSQAVKHANVRIVAATNKNLEAQIRQGLLREDFFYRLNVLTITTPPLRTRREDIPLLIDHLLPQYSAGATPAELPITVIEALYTHDWPGNIRELQKELQHYLSTGRLKFTNLRHAESLGRGDRSGEEIEQIDVTLTLREAVERFEKRFIARMLNQNFGHRGNTAAKLGLNHKNLYRKMKKYGLLPSYQDTEAE